MNDADTSMPPEREAAALDEEFTDAESQRAVAAAWRAAAAPAEPPRSLMLELEHDADRFFAPAALPLRSSRAIARLGWVVAAAAALVAAGLFFLREPVTRTVYVTDGGAAEVLADYEQMNGDARIARGSLALISVAEGDNDAEADYLWDAATATGFLRIENLPASGADEAYQIWIVDPTRPESDGRNRVDGGVFAVPAGRRSIVVPIVPKLTVAKMGGIAITREPAGGSVVSELGDRLLLMGK